MTSIILNFIHYTNIFGFSTI